MSSVAHPMNGNASFETSWWVSRASTSRERGPESAKPTVASEMSRTETSPARNCAIQSANQRMCHWRR